MGIIRFLEIAAILLAIYLVYWGGKQLLVSSIPKDAPIPVSKVTNEEEIDALIVTLKKKVEAYSWMAEHGAKKAAKNLKYYEEELKKAEALKTKFSNI